MDESALDRHRDLQLEILAVQGAALAPGGRILDFGCGEGALVEALARRGFDAYGCDIVVHTETDRIRAILDPYRLPFDDGSFDVVVSDQVLEHVVEHRVAAAEIARVCRPGAATLHVFPGRWRLIEPHVDVPLAGAFQHHVWLAFWAHVGIRNPFQRGLAAHETVARNAAFLRENTNYIPRRDIARIFREHFEEVRFVERDVFRRTDGRSRRLAPLASIPGVAAAYGTLFMQTLFAARPRHTPRPRPHAANR
jgi:SAM-dependent methyltransferase